MVNSPVHWSNTAWYTYYLLTYLLNYLLPLWSRVILEKLTCTQPVKKFPEFCGTHRFITAFTSAHHLSLSCARSIRSMPPHSNFWRSILILSSHLCLGLPSGLLPSGFPTKTVYTSLLSPIRATCAAYPILLDFITWIIFGEVYRSLSSSICSFLHSHITSSLFISLVSNTLSVHFSITVVVKVKCTLVQTVRQPIGGG